MVHYKKTKHLSKASLDAKSWSCKNTLRLLQGLMDKRSFYVLPTVKARHISLWISAGLPHSTIPSAGNRIWRKNWEPRLSMRPEFKTGSNPYLPWEVRHPRLQDNDSFILHMNFTTNNLVHSLSVLFVLLISSLWSEIGIWHTHHHGGTGKQDLGPVKHTALHFVTSMYLFPVKYETFSCIIPVFVVLKKFTACKKKR